MGDLHATQAVQQGAEPARAAKSCCAQACAFITAQGSIAADKAAVATGMASGPGHASNVCNIKDCVDGTTLGSAEGRDVGSILGTLLTDRPLLGPALGFIDGITLGTTLGSALLVGPLLSPALGNNDGDALGTALGLALLVRPLLGPALGITNGTSNGLILGLHLVVGCPDRLHLALHLAQH